MLQESVAFTVFEITELQQKPVSFSSSVKDHLPLQTCLPEVFIKFSRLLRTLQLLVNKTRSYLFHCSML